MARTLLQLCQQACVRARLPRPRGIIGNNERVARRAEVAAQDAVNHMVEAATNQDGWSTQHVAYQFQTQSGVQIYTLPADYQGMVSEAIFVKDNPRWMTGPRSPYRWRATEAFLNVNPYPFDWRIRNNDARSNATTLEFLPAPSGETIMLEYISSGVILSQGGADTWDVMTYDDGVWDRQARTAEFLDDNDICLLPENVLSQGITAYLTESPVSMERFDSLLDTALSKDRGGTSRALCTDYEPGHDYSVFGAGRGAEFIVAPTTTDPTVDNPWLDITNSLAGAST